jgi:hypothetical protein
MIQETISKPSTGDQETFVIVEREDWRNSIIQYLQHGEELEGKEEAKLKKMAAYYTIIGDRLYKRGFSSPMLLCVGEAESRHILDEIHSGSCGSHIGARSLTGKVPRAGFFWPTLLRDANSCVRSCDKCQRHADLHHAPGEPLKSVHVTLAFLYVGSRHFGAIHDIPKPSKIPIGSCRLLYQVDRSGASSNNLIRQSQEILLEKSHLQVWASTFHSVRQRNSIHK